jgi:eukaryotic-like serine/threonine-protein kinase
VSTAPRGPRRREYGTLPARDARGRGGRESVLAIKRVAILLLKYGLLAVALAITAGLSALTTMRVVLKAQEVSVPSLVGRRVPDAGSLAAKHRLLLRVEGKRNDPRMPADLIVEQDPGPGSLLKTQRSVRVWVSLGPRRLTVPSVEGESLRSGRLTLEQAGVNVGRILEVSNAAEEGTILLQRPPAGDTDRLAEEGASLLVSRGPGSRDFVMPDLIGKRADSALVWLREAGLNVTDVNYKPYFGVEPGVVLRQTPPSGYRVTPRAAVALEVSRSAQ